MTKVVHALLALIMCVLALGTTPVSHPVRVVRSFDLQTTWAAGESGLFLSSDGGMEWRRLSPHPFSDVSFPDRNRGWSIYDRSVFRTDDGGMTWEQVKHLTVTDETIRVVLENVQFVSEQRGWIMGKTIEYQLLVTGLPGHSFILSTEDGAETWKRIDLDFVLDSIHMVSEKKGWAIRGRSLMRSRDGGATWEVVRIPARGRLTSLHARVEGHVVVATAEGQILSTFDEGLSWTTSNHAFVLKDIQFVDERFGWMVTIDPSARIGNRQQSLHVTSDGGSTWEQVLSLEKGSPLPFFYNHHQGFVVQSHPQILPTAELRFKVFTTADGGRTWQEGYSHP